MKTIDAMQGRTALILAEYGLPPITGNRHYKGECPVCGRKGKFRIDDKNGTGTWICVCGSGDLMRLLELVTGKPFAMLAQEVDRIIGNDFKAERSPEPIVNRPLQRTVERFKHIIRLEGTDGEKYLNQRGIFKMPSGGVKWSDGETHRESNKTWPCLYSIASNEYGEAVQRHLTFLWGDQKAPIEPNKKMFSLQEYSGSIAVKLFRPQSTLGISEGIETALSAHQLYKLPVWSTLNAVLMGKFKAPPGVDTLMIFADSDPSLTGLASAMECGKKNLLSNNDVRRVVIRWPERGDFNDVLISGQKVFSWEGCR